MREVLQMQWIHNQAPESFNLIHFIPPGLHPVFPTEFGKTAAFASRTATSHTAANPWPCTALHKPFLDHLWGIPRSHLRDGKPQGQPTCTVTFPFQVRAFLLLLQVCLWYEALPFSISKNVFLRCGYALLSTDKQTQEGKNCKNPGSKHSSDSR